jgi:hypothetical protein
MGKQPQRSVLAAARRRNPPAGQLAHAEGGGGEVLVRGEARPRRIAGYAPTAPLLGAPAAQAVVGQVEPRLGTTITRAHVWLVQAPGHTEQCVWGVIVLTAIAAMETLYGSVAEEGG